MAYPVFPNIKSPDMNGGIQEESFKPLNRTEFEGNVAAVRPRTVKVRKRWTIKWSKLPQADYDVLRAFFNSMQGRPFSWLNNADGYQYTVVFSENQLRAGTVMYDGSISGLRYSVQTSVEEYEEQWQFATEDDDVAAGYSVVLQLSVGAGQTVGFSHDSGCIIDWGDGTVESGTGSEESHEYETGGSYTLSITPSQGMTEFNLSGLGMALTAIRKFALPDGVVSFRRMFAGTSLRHLPAFNVHHDSVTDVTEEFDSCVLLESLGGLVNPDSVVAATAQFYRCTSLRSLYNFRNGAGTASCDMQFYGCTSLNEVPDGFRNGANTVTMARQFYNCSLTTVPFYNVFPAGRSPLNVTMMFNGNPRLTGYVPPERTWGSKRTFTHGVLGAPFLNCAMLDNYHEMPQLWSGADFTQRQTITPVFVDNSGMADATVNGEFAFRLLNGQDAEEDVVCTVTGGVAQNVSLIQGQRYVVIPPEGYLKVFRCRFYPATIFDHRTVDVENSFNVGKMMSSVELLALPDDTRILYKCRFTSADTHRIQSLVYFGVRGNIYYFSWGDGDTDTITNRNGTAYSDHTYVEDGEYLVLCRDNFASVSGTHRFFLTHGTFTYELEQADALAKQYGQHITDLYYFTRSNLSTLRRAFMRGQFTELPEDFTTGNISDLQETFYGVPLREITETLLAGIVSGSKNMLRTFMMPADDYDHGWDYDIPALWARPGVTFTNQSDCFTGRVKASNFAAAVANGWATETAIDAEAEAAKVDSLTDELQASSASLAQTLENDEWDADSDWAPLAAALETMLAKARECMERSWLHAQAGNMLPAFASMWMRADGVANFHTPPIPVTPGVSYTLSVTGGYMAMVRGYDANGDVISGEYAIADNDTVTWTPATAVQAVVALSGGEGTDLLPIQGLLDMASPRMEVAQ